MQEQRRVEKARLRRTPSRAAVLITVEAGGSYADTMKKAAAAVDLKDLSISGLRVERRQRIVECSFRSPELEEQRRLRLSCRECQKCSGVKRGCGSPVP